MLVADRFRELLPDTTKIRRIARDQDEVYWELYGEAGGLIGYGFFQEVPKTLVDAPDAEEFDKYEVAGIVDLNCKVAALKITRHPDFDGNLWAPDVVEKEFATQYLGLSANVMRLSPEGRIDAISEATISSKLVTDAVRNCLLTIGKAST